MAEEWQQQACRRDRPAVASASCCSPTVGRPAGLVLATLLGHISCHTWGHKAAFTWLAWWQVVHVPDQVL
jgi:hypothetical protein